MSRVSLLDERLARQIFRRRLATAGSPAGPSMLFDYEPGDTIPGEVFTRASTATYFDSNGILQTAASGVKRDAHYIGGVRHLLLEPQRTNSFTYSNDVTGASWAPFGVSPGRALDAVGMDGVANHASTLTDDNTTGWEGVSSMGVAVANDSNKHTLRVWFKKDTNTARFPGLGITLGGGATPITTDPMINTQTGALAFWAGGASANVALRVLDHGLWWCLEVVLTNNSTGNNSIAWDLYAAVSDVWATNTATATGSVVIGNVQLEQNSDKGSTPIFTTNAAATRASDALYADFPIAYQEMTGLIDFVDLSFDGVSVHGIGSSSPPKAFVAVGSQPYVQNGSALAQLGAAGALNDRVELMPYFTSDYKVQLTRSINGAASTSTALSAAATPFTDWSGGRIDFASDPGSGGPGMFAIRKLKYAAGAKTLAEMRAL